MTHTIHLGLFALCLAVLSACGGGGGSNVNTTGSAPPPTQATTITVIDGYIQGAVVCVDKNKNDSCDTGETKGTTGSDGKVTLDIAVDDVGKYPIVAFVPASAIDKDDGKALGTAFTLIAPAGQTLVSPLTTLVQHLMVNGGKTYAEAAMQMQQAIGDPAQDYIVNTQATQTRAAAKILAKLMQTLPAKMPAVSGQTDAQKTAAVYTILVSALPDIRSQAQTLLAAPACSPSITSPDCQSALLGAASTLQDSGKLDTAFQTWNASRRLITTNLANPNVLDTVTFSVNNLYSGITSVDWDLGDGSTVQTSTVTNATASTTTRYLAKGDKTVTASYKNASGAVLATDSLTVSIAEGSVSQTASISSASANGTTVGSGGRTDSLTLTLSGTYSGNALGNDYSIRVLDGSTTLGDATLAADAATKTWSFTTGTLAAGSHDFKAVVVRNIDGKLGTASGAYTVKIGNSVSAPSGSNVLDTITLTLSNLWSNVRSVVFSFTGNVDELADTQQSTQTLNAPNNGLWSNITTAFKTTGSKVINLVFKDAANGQGNTLDTNSISISVGQGSVSQKASINNVQDDSSGTAVDISGGVNTTDTTPVISGTVDVPLSQFYDVAVFDNGTKLTGSLSYTNNRKDWRFTPSTALSPTLHSLTAKVVRFDGLEGAASSARALYISSGNISYSPVNPKVGDTVTFTASNLGSEVSTITWDFGDGKTLLTRPGSGSASTSNTYTYDGSMAVTVTYKDRYARTLGADNLVVPVVPTNLVAQALGMSVAITGAVNDRDQASIANGGRKTSGGAIKIVGTITPKIDSNYTLEIFENGLYSYGLGDGNYGSLSIDQNTGNFVYSLRDAQSRVGNYVARVVDRNNSSRKSAWSNPYKIIFSDTPSVQSTTVNAWDDVVLTVNGMRRPIAQQLVRFSETATDVADGRASVLNDEPGTFLGASLTLKTAFVTPGPKNIIVEYKDASGNSLDLDSVSLTVNPAVPITQTAKVTGSAGFSDVAGKLTLNGTVSAPIGEFYSVRVFDNNATTPLAGTITFNSARNGWTFVSDGPLAAGDHDFKAVVVRPGDGATGPSSDTATITVPQSRFSKIASTGQALANQGAIWNDAGSEGAGTQWDCVRDTRTGRIWENKSNDPTSLRYKGHSYTWFLNNKNGSGISEGVDSGGNCTGLADGKCNSEAYVKAVNDARLCGGTGWRIPTKEELQALQEAGVKKGISVYFPNLENGDYWNIAWGEFGTFNFLSDNYQYVYDDDPIDYGPYGIMLVRTDTGSTVAVGDLNKLNASKTNPGVYETINLWVSNVLDSVTKVL